MSTASALLDAARAELGTTELPPGSNRTEFAAEAGHLNGYAWCATFVVAIARRCGIKLPSESAWTPSMFAGFIAKGTGYRGAKGARPGDVVFFDFPDSKTGIQHVGFVESVKADGTLVCIEGNTSAGTSGSQDNGGGVYRRTRPPAYVVGYGRPAYTQEATVPTPEFQAPPPNYDINDAGDHIVAQGIAALCDSAGNCTGYLILGKDGGVFGFGPGARYMGRVS